MTLRERGTWAVEDLHLERDPHLVYLCNRVNPTNEDDHRLKLTKSRFNLSQQHHDEELLRKKGAENVTIRVSNTLDASSICSILLGDADP